MKKIFTLILFLLPFISFSQPYGNEWIHFNQTYLKIKVINDGVYRVRQSTLAAAIPTLSSITGANFQLFERGVEIPIYVSTNNTGDPNFYIEFYAVHNNGWFDSTLYQTHSWQMNDELSLFNDTAAYFLTWNNLTTNVRFTTITNNLTAHPPKENYCWFRDVSVNGGNRTYGSNYSLGVPTYPAGNGDICSSEFGINEGYGSPEVNYASWDFPLVTAHPYLSGPPATCNVQYVGQYPTDHNVETGLGTTVFDLQNFSGYVTKRVSFQVSNLNLINAATTNCFVSSANSNASIADVIKVCNMKIKYPRQFNFDNATTAKFSLNAAGGNQYIVIKNFNEQGAQPVLYDLTSHIRIVGTSWSVAADSDQFVLPGWIAEHECVLVSNNLGAINEVTVMKQRNFTDYSLPGNQGDFIILSHPFFFDDGFGHNYINDYKNLKTANGFTPVVVDVTELYDQFAYGIDLHPMCIRQFSHLAKNTWGQSRLYLFLVGKGLEYTYFNENLAGKAHCYVPTWGRPGSDILLTATDTSDIPLVSTGRIPCLTTDDLKSYLDKVHDYLDIQNDTTSLQWTNADKLWTKNIVHVAGGYDLNQQQLFQNNLNHYADIADSIYFGASIHNFYKNSSVPVYVPTQHTLDSLLDHGTALLTFFGHSAASTFDYQIPFPEDLNNDYGKYPMFYTNGCLVGDVFQDSRNLADRYILTQDKGVIGFLASDFFGFDGSLNTYATNFYRNMCIDYYNQPVGDLVRKNIEDLYVVPATGINRSTFQQVILNMDPSLRLMTHTLPDYDIESNTVYTVPNTITAGLDSFALNVVITNLGKAINDSFYVYVEQHLPDGTTNYFSKQIRAPYLVDTVTFFIHVNPFADLGPNQFDVSIDLPDNNIQEMADFTNNHVSFTKVILSNDIIPVWPYEFSIVNTPTVILKASTVDALAPLRNYVFEIDTTEKFNSPLLHTTPFNFSHTGGVVEWSPLLVLNDSTVYYWRTTVDTGQDGIHDYSWHNSSFIYMNGSSPGWNQSHYFQFKKDLFATVRLDTTRIFSFDPDIKQIGFRTGNYFFEAQSGLTDDELGNILVNGTRYCKWGWTNPRMAFLIIDNSTGFPIVNTWHPNPDHGLFGSWQDQTPGPTYYGLEWNSLAPNLGAGANYRDEVYDSMISMINWLPNGWYLAGITIKDWKPANGDFTSMIAPVHGVTLQSAFNSLGLTQINSADSIAPYCFLAQKGNPSFAKEFNSPFPYSVLDTSFNIVGHWTQGYVESPKIGPAVSWSNFHYRAHEIEAGNDHYNVEIYGIDTAGNKILLSTMNSAVFAGDTDIHLLNAALYPFLQLKLNVLDSVTNTPLQLDYWRINYQPFPEVAVDASSYFVLQNSDTVAQRVPFKMQVALRNVSAYDFDSVYVKFQVTDVSNGQHVFYKTEKPILANDTIHASFNFPTVGFAGLNQLFMEINPNGIKHQQEQYHFNNYLLKPFDVTKDNLNPLLDVTFDGVHILNNDIVSAKPEIVIKLNDDSKLVPLDDTSGISMKLTFPDGSIHPIHYNNSTATFYPADVTNLSKVNQAEVIYKPVLFTDGIYTLTVQGYDRGGNAAGNYDYSISFEIINKALISNVLNYPNPFTTQTHFVFTLTGSVVPEFMKIQIMTISGKVVKEIFMNELGPLHIGRNITDYVWDGTDQYGDNLANGVYLYRVVTRLDGKNLDEYGTNTDKYFKEGIGKMVLAR